jgi:hypothetical protein
LYSTDRDNARSVRPPKLVLPDYAWGQTELKHYRNVTLQLLWEECRAARESRLPA